jgi:hypothetical protein
MKRHLIEIVIQMALCILFRDAPSIRVSGPGLTADLLDQAVRRRAPGARWEVGFAGPRQMTHPLSSQMRGRGGDATVGAVGRHWRAGMRECGMRGRGGDAGAGRECERAALALADGDALAGRRGGDARGMGGRDAGAGWRFGGRAGDWLRRGGPPGLPPRDSAAAAAAAEAV